MANAKIIGEVNLPTKTALYTGLETDSAYTTVNNEEKTISVDLKESFITDRIVLTDANQEIAGYKNFTDHLMVTGDVSSDLIPSGNGDHNLGSYEHPWSDLNISGVINKNTDGFGFKLPSSGALNSNSYLATDYDIDMLENDISNISGQITEKADKSNTVTTDTNQTIAGVKTFDDIVTFDSTVDFKDNSTFYQAIKSYQEINLGGDPEVGRTGMLGLYNQETRRYDYLVGGSDGGDFQIPSMNKLAINYLTVPYVMSKWDNQYGLELPDSGEWTSNKTIATTEDCGTKLYKHDIVNSFGMHIYLITHTSSPYTSFPELNGSELIGGYISGSTTMYKIFYITSTHFVGITGNGFESVAKSTYEIGTLVDTVTPL